MNASKTPDKLQVAQRFAEMPKEKRRVFLEALQAKGIAFSRLPIPPMAREGKTLPLSYAQQRLWFLNRFDPASTVYHMPGAFRLRGTLDHDLLERSFARIVERHEILRTTYCDGESGAAEQVVHDVLPLKIAFTDLTSLPSAECEAQARKVTIEIIRTVFDLENEPPLRAALLKLSDDDHVLVVTLHHIAADGASIPLLMRELEQTYLAYRKGEEPVLSLLPVQYADYTIWQRNWLEAGERDRQLAYWREQLGETPSILNLPTDRPRPATPSHRGEEDTFTLAPALAESLRSLAQRKGSTLFMVLLAAFNLLLHRYSGQSDLRVGIPAANRQRLETEGLLGCFVNTLVLRTLVDGTQSFDDLLAAVKTGVMAAQDHQDLPFESLIEALQPERSLSQNPLFQVMFDHQQHAGSGLERMADLSVETLELPVSTTKFDLSLSTSEDGSGTITGRIGYASDLFDRASICRLQEHFETILTQVVEDPARRVSEFDLLSENEKAELLLWSRDGDAVEFDLAPVHSLIERQASDRPEAPAILFKDETLCFGDLNRRANRLAHRLISLGLKPETRVGVSMERSPDLVMTFLAVFKAGAAYVPLDPAYPADRLRVIQEDAGIRLIISQSGIEPVTELEGDCPILLLDREDLSGQPDSNPAVPVDLRNLAYIIYTSGSTGRPKGVAVEHGPLAMHCLATGTRYDITSDSRELHFLSFTFDGAHERWLVPFCYGASIVLRDESLWSVEQTYETIREQGVTHAGFPPKYIQQLAEWAAQEGNPPPVWLYSFGGEAMSRAGLELVQSALRPQRVINGYGPTETVVSPVVWKGTADSRIESPYVPIGRPVGDRRAYVLDANLMPVPQGLPGELCLGGSGLARGYHGQPGATAEKFVPDPFGEPGSRLYRTGDTVCWRDGGVIEFIGRSDHQVKVRGFRVELGDIEAHLQAQPGVRTAVVVPHEANGYTRLVGYVVPEKDVSLVTAVLTEGLARVLPDYMVPSSLMLLNSLPVTSTGKLDRKELPEPQWSGGRLYVAPRTAAEITLALIWQETLGNDRIGVKDNFFELGGDSILSLQIVARARRNGLRLTPKQLFEKQTIEELALVALAEDTSGEILDEKPEGEVPLTPIQAAFFAEVIPGRDRWNQSVLLRGTSPVDPQLLEQALAKLTEHHDALRLRFHQDADGNWRQAYVESLSAELLQEQRIEDDADLESRIDGLCDEAQGGLNLAQGPLLRALLIHLPDGDHRLFLVAHHLVVDGVSWRVLLEDLQRIYGQLSQGMPSTLPPKTASYQRWARQLERYAGSAEVKAEAGYWKHNCVAEALPCDMPQGENRQALLRTVSLRLERSRTQELLKEAPAAYRTQINDLLLTALARAVGDWAGRQEISVLLEGHGREDLFEGLDVSRSAGWFTSVYPVRLAPSNDDWGDAIRQVKECLRAVPGKGIGYGLLRYFGDAPTREALNLGEVSLTFNYLGQFDGSLADGLWQPADEPSGKGKDPAAPLGSRLIINGQVSDGALALHCQFSEGLYRVSTVEALMERFRQALNALIDHCLAQEAGQASPSDFPLAQLSQPQLDALPVPAPEIEDIYPLSAMQRGMVLDGARNPASDAYMVQVHATISGLEVERLKTAWRTAMARHSVLRSSFVWQGDLPEPLQIVHKTAALPVQVFDWRGLSDIEVRWDALCDTEYRHHFTLDHAPLLRVVLARVDEETYRFASTWHHALLDGWSMSQLLGEVLRLYDNEPLPPGVGRFRDYIAWTRRQADVGSGAFWQQRLELLDAPTLLAEALGAPDRPAGQSAQERTLDEEKVRHLLTFAGAEKVTLNTLVQAAWILLLQHYTGQAVVAFGATVSGRSADLPDIERIMGLLVGTLPVVQEPRPDETVGTWLRALQADNLALREHEHSPPPELQCWGTSSAGRHEAPFDTVLIFENYPVDEALRQTVRGKVSFSDVGNRGQTSYPLTGVIIPRETLTLRLEYSGAVFDARAIELLVDRFERTLLQLGKDADACLGDVVAAGTAEVPVPGISRSDADWSHSHAV